MTTDDHGYDALNTVLPADLARFVRAMTPETHGTFDALQERQVEEGFPIVGPEVGGVLRVLARLVDARRIFEFGSGMGYSAFWMAPVLPSDGTIVLTDFDDENLAIARDFLTRAGHVDRARFEVGDALETYERYEGPFDLVLIDNGETEYVETFEAVREDVRRGGVVCADNVMGGPAVQADRAVAALEGDPDRDDTTESTRGVVEYLLTVRDDPEFESTLLPVGEGLAVSVKR